MFSRFWIVIQDFEMIFKILRSIQDFEIPIWWSCRTHVPTRVCPRHWYGSQCMRVLAGSSYVSNFTDSILAFKILDEFSRFWNIFKILENVSSLERLWKSWKSERGGKLWNYSCWQINEQGALCATNVLRTCPCCKFIRRYYICENPKSWDVVKILKFKILNAKSWNGAQNQENSRFWIRFKILNFPDDNVAGWTCAWSAVSA